MALQDVADQTQALHALKSKGVNVRAADLAFLSPYSTSKLKRYGDYPTDLKPEGMPTRMTLPLWDLAKVAEFARILLTGLHVSEVHDATAMGELIQSENLGFCAMGEGGLLAESGATTLGGRIPINPSGGLESKGHPIGATGLGQVFELVSQLRGECGPRQVEGARFAIQENGGGIWGIEESVAHVGIYGRAV